MRKIRKGKNRFQDLKNVPKGVCKMCGGKGRYKETFTYKNPVIHHCLYCRGTGIVKIRVKYIGEFNDNSGLWTGSIYDVISESESDYVIHNRNKEMLQIAKDLFEIVS